MLTVTLSVLTLALLAVAGILAALCIVRIRRAVRRQKHTPSDTLWALAEALREVQLFGPSRPVLEFQAQGVASEVIDAANELLGRLDRYRERLLARDQRSRRLLSNITDILYQADSELRLTWVTDSVRHVLGYASEEICGRRISELLVDGNEAGMAFYEHSRVSNHPIRMYRRDGSIAWLLVTARRSQDSDGSFTGSEGSFRDGTELVEAERALLKERERAQTTLASIGDSVITTTVDGVVDYMNPSAEALVNATQAQAKGRLFEEICDLRDSRSGTPMMDLISRCIASRAGMRKHIEAVLHNRQPDREFSVRVSVSPISDGYGEISGTVVVLHDITELREISRRMSHQANHDSLTGIANRQAFEKLVRDSLADAERQDSDHALCYLDLDQFKVVNDTCGHAAGDELLRQIAIQLSGQIREHDSIARLGGDEFGVLLRDTKIEQAVSTAERMRQCVEDFRFHWKDKLFRVGVSIGLVPIAGANGSFSDVLSNADTACYIAKDKGRNRVHVHFPGGGEVVRRHSDMERMRRLSEAIDDGGLLLYAQVIRAVDWQPGDAISVECLVRMRDADGMLLEPAAFLPIAERYHIMSKIDRCVLERALEVLANSEYSAANIDYFSINLSGQSMTDEHFVDLALDLLKQSGIDATRLVFEITETSAVTNLNRAAYLIKALRDIGCRFALDDFGSGLSSFSYLKNLPLDFIKIDGSFVRNVLSDSVDLETVKAINQVGHTMGLKTVAEYVESKEILDMLHAIGVDYAQGFYIAKPVPLESLLQDDVHFDQEPEVKTEAGRKVGKESAI